MPPSDATPTTDGSAEPADPAPAVASASTPRPIADVAPEAAPLAEPDVAGAGDLSRTGSGRPLGPRTLGRYRVVRRLGSGGFSRVYRAHDPELEIDVAVKLLRAELAADPEIVERFRKEAGTAAKLRHPNVITVITVGRLDEPFDGVPAGAPYLVMDFLPGTLADRLLEHGPLDEGDTARIGAEVARGLAFAHRGGIVHRDVKPGNVLFAPDGRAVVADFGIARAVSGAQVPVSRNVVLGTPSYFSPEQARGLPMDGRSDVYSLGVTLFEMASGQLPFAGDDWYSVMRQHVEAPPPPLRSVAPGVTEAFAYVVERCLRKDPAERFQSADEVAHALDAVGASARGDAATIAVPALSGTAGRRTPAVRRWPWAVAALAVLAVGSSVWLSVGTNARTRAALRGDSLGVGALVPTAADSARADSAQRDSAIVGAPAFATLALNAPPSAQLRLDGTVVGQGSWESDSIAPGRHVLRATVPALPGCETADAALPLELTPGERRVVTLRPTGCGRVLLDDVAPTPATFALAHVGGRGDDVRGELPRRTPVLLPEGEYTLSIQHPGCAEFRDQLRVRADGSVRRAGRIRLICG